MGMWTSKTWLSDEIVEIMAWEMERSDWLRLIWGMINRVIHAW